MSEILTENRIDIEEKLSTGDDQDFSGWFCIKTDAWYCTNCGGCVFYMTAGHSIIVWPEIDDPDMLFHANRCKELGRNPKVVEYEHSMGRCVSYFQVQAHGFKTCDALTKGYA
jgi:hypothetical protein